MPPCKCSRTARQRAGNIRVLHAPDGEQACKAGRLSDD
jgi:hypothetical protein